MLKLALSLSLAMKGPKTRDAGADEQNLGSEPAYDEPEKPLNIRFSSTHGARQHKYAAQA
jgi:hypothetical protein